MEGVACASDANSHVISWVKKSCNDVGGQHCKSLGKRFFRRGLHYTVCLIIPIWGVDLHQKSWLLQGNLALPSIPSFLRSLGFGLLQDLCFQGCALGMFSTELFVVSV